MNTPHLVKKIAKILATSLRRPPGEKLDGYHVMLKKDITVWISEPASSYYWFITPKGVLDDTKDKKGYKNYIDSGDDLDMFHSIEDLYEEIVNEDFDEENATAAQERKRDNAWRAFYRRNKMSSLEEGTLNGFKRASRSQIYNQFDQYRSSHRHTFVIAVDDMGSAALYVHVERGEYSEVDQHELLTFASVKEYIDSLDTFNTVMNAGDTAKKVDATELYTFDVVINYRKNKVTCSRITRVSKVPKTKF